MKLIVKNLFSLGFVQGINLLIPLLLTPYLIHTIGVSAFGVVATAQGFVYFFIILTDFGFNITSVRRLAQSKNNKQEIEDIVNGVFFSKLFLVLLSLVIYLPLVLTIPQFNSNMLVYLGSFSMVIGQFLLPVWFYQGIEDLKKTILPVIIFKILSIAAIIIVVKNTEDAHYANFLLGLGNIFTGIILYYLLIRQYKITLRPISIRQLIAELKNSMAIFISNIGVVIYGNTSLIILSFFLTPTVLGVYSIVDKIIQLLKSLLGIIHQATYPRLCNIINENKMPVVVFIRKIYIPVWIGVFLLSIFLFFAPTVMVSYFVKDPELLLFASDILKQVSFVIFITSLNMPFFQSLLAYKKDWLTVRILLGGSIVSIVLNLILVPFFKIGGTIITIYLVEAMVTGLLIYFMAQLKNENEN